MSDPIENLPPHGRRGFFAAGLARLMSPLAEYIEQKLPFPLPQLRDTLRPPGALAEKQFLETCMRCGACADACPARAIRLRPHDAPDTGTPFVDADRAACVVCDELACMKSCPSGALRLVGRLEIRMGLARLRDQHCLRTKGENCTICVDKCPLGSIAIRIDNGRVQVTQPRDTLDHGLGEGCVGCGACQLYCPTDPKAIIIDPIHL